MSQSAVTRKGLAIASSDGKMTTATVETGADKRTGEIRTAQVTSVRTTDAAGKAITFRTDPGFNHAPGTGLAEVLKRKQTDAGAIK